ncbi:MAG: TRAP transporter small permease [Burkholderiales bacterium]|nr:TRAP transporter small permease [Burkholderiales bacterium]
MNAPPKAALPADDDPFGGEAVLDESGRFHATDAPIDLSGYKWEDWLTLAVFWLLALTVFYQFFTRYVLDDSAAWTEEIARYLLIVVTFIGSSMAIRRNNHIHVEFIYRWLPAAVARAMSTAVDLVRIAFLAYATWLSIELMPKMANLNMTVVDLSMKWIYGAVTLGFAMMTFRAVQVAIRHKRRGWSLLERPGETED